jgi:hypothetical protein
MGLGLILLTNAVVLGSVWDNRSGDRDSTLALTDRELASPINYWHSAENSGLDLHLVWRIEQSQPRAYTPGSVYFGGEGDWLNSAKLTELGIKVHARSPSPKNAAAFNSSLPADVLLVLEMDGPAYQRTLERACRPPANGAPDAVERQKNCLEEKSGSSRLFVVDAGLDREALRKKYPDRNQYAVVRGQIQASLITQMSERQLRGYVHGISNDEINVPSSMRTALGDLKPVIGQVYGQRGKPLAAVVTFGRRLEPWLASLSPRSSQPN